MCETCNLIPSNQIRRSCVLKELDVGFASTAHLLTVEFGTILADVGND